MLELVLLDGTGRRFPLKEKTELTVGSAAQCEVRLTASDVSRSHALLSISKGKVRLIDLGSKNGTFVDGNRVKEAQVSPGSMVRFSSVPALLVPQSASSAGSEEPPPPASPSPTEEAYPIGFEEGLAWLLWRWRQPSVGAVSALLEWLVAGYRIRGAAALSSRDGEIAVLAAHGSMDGALEMPELTTVLGVETNQPEVEALPLSETGVGIHLMHGGGLPALLLVGHNSPASTHLQLFMALLGVAIRLDGSA